MVSTTIQQSTKTDRSTFLLSVSSSKDLQEDLAQLKRSCFICQICIFNCFRFFQMVFPLYPLWPSNYTLDATLETSTFENFFKIVNVRYNLGVTTVYGSYVI